MKMIQVGVEICRNLEAALSREWLEGKPMPEALRHHWPEYLMEATGLGLFMLSACFFATILGHPASPVPQAIADPLVRRLLIGMAMGLTAVGIIYSPWGQQSGAHLNPSVTLSFFRLGKVEPWDALFYVMAQFTGGISGVLVAAVLLGQVIAHPAVNYVATAPGMAGASIAFLAESGISFILMSVVLRVSNTPSLARFTGLFAGALVATYITLEAPLSGMSMNPARSFGSALAAQLWTGLWIYFSAPPLGMLIAAELYQRRQGTRAVICAKLHHHNRKRCIFRCGYPQRPHMDTDKIG
jgi:aquaporin Z